MKLKLALVGPSGSGKSYLANILGNEGMSDTSGIKPPYRPTHSVRIIEFSLSNVELRKYNLDVDIQLWEVGGNPSLKSIYPGVQSNLDGVILMYDVSKDAHIREASAYHMNFVTHSPSGVSPLQCLILGNKFRGAAEIGTQKIVGVPPKARHIAMNIEDDPNRLREEVKSFISAVAQIVIDQEKANIAEHELRKNPGHYLSKRLTVVDYRRVKTDLEKEKRTQREEEERERIESSPPPISKLTETEFKIKTPRVKTKTSSKKKVVSAWGDTDEEEVDEPEPSPIRKIIPDIPQDIPKSKFKPIKNNRIRKSHSTVLGRPRKTDF